MVCCAVSLGSRKLACLTAHAGPLFIRTLSGATTRTPALRGSVHYLGRVGYVATAVIESLPVGRFGQIGLAETTLLYGSPRGHLTR